MGFFLPSKRLIKQFLKAYDEYIQSEGRVALKKAKEIMACELSDSNKYVGGSKQLEDFRWEVKYYTDKLSKALIVHKAMVAAEQELNDSQ